MDHGIWATWYDLADDSRGRFLDWLHMHYLPALQQRPGFAWSAHYRNQGGGTAMRALGDDVLRLWLNDGSCIQLRPERRNHVWSYDFVEAQTHDGRKLRLMTLIDEFTRECLAIRVARRINGFGVLETMADVMLMRGVPEHIRSDNGAEMTAKVVRNWLTQVGSKTLYIEPGSPWENGYCESFNENYAMSC